MDGGRVDGHGLFRRDVIRTVLEVIVLSLLLRLQVETRQTAKVLLADGLVHRSAAPDTLSVVVSRVGPPVRLHLDVPQDHVLNRRR